MIYLLSEIIMNIVCFYEWQTRAQFIIIEYDVYSEEGIYMSKGELLKKLSDCVVEMEEEEVVDVAVDYIKEGHDPQEGMLEGLVDGMKRASDLYDEGEYYVPELIGCSDAMYAGIEEFNKVLPEAALSKKAKIAIGVIEGDTHDIGKNLVRILMETGGFDVTDLGRDVPVDTFVDYVKNNDVDILCISSLMTTTMPGMERVINELKAQGLRDKVKVMIGGAPVSKAFAERIGADGYTKNAIEAVKFAQNLLGLE